jgi:acetyl esterase/lipase
MSERRYHPDLRSILPLLPAGLDLSSAESIQALRSDREALFGAAPPDRDDVAVEDRRVPGPGGAPDVPIRIYRPIARAGAPRPGILEIHGGGFLLGSIAMMDPWCQRIAAEVDAVVVSVEYRLAPENPFPAGLEDCYAALRFTSAESAALGVDPARIAVAGQSAGGGLAAATALLARDRGGPPICFQLLEIPELDDRLETPSMRAFTDTPLWNRPNAVWSWRHYLGRELGRDLGRDVGRGPGRADDAGEVSPYAAPARAKDLSGLPPAYVSTMEYDPLRDEGILYALRLLQAGVPVELHSYAGTFHGSGLVPNAEPSIRNFREVVDLLRRELAG